MLPSGSWLVFQIIVVLSNSGITDGKLGMTGRKHFHIAELGIDRVDCSNCNAYTGDTDCETELPVLCVRLDRSNTPRPPYVVYGSCPTCAYANNIQFYHGWNGGHVATTLPVKGSKFRNRGEVDAFCSNSFGSGWQVSYMGDGRWIPGMNGTRFANQEWTANAQRIQTGQWGYYTYGNIRNDTRYWTHQTDQPATCWENELTGGK